MGSWKNEDLIKPTTRGFVYLIINKQTNMLYIGKKKTLVEGFVKVEGRQNRKKVIKPSNWRTYYGSSVELKADIRKRGSAHFERYILGAFDSLHSVNYAETDLHFHLEVLSDKGRFLYYNKGIKTHLLLQPPSDREYINKINEILKGL